MDGLERMTNTRYSVVSGYIGSTDSLLLSDELGSGCTGEVVYCLCRKSLRNLRGHCVAGNESEPHSCCCEDLLWPAEAK